MKKIGKLMAAIGVCGAALAGLWYFIDTTKRLEADLEDEDIDDDAADAPVAERSYVTLDPECEKKEASAEEKEALKKAVTDAVKDSAKKAEEEAIGVGVAARDDAKKANDFEFKSFDN